MGGPAGMAQADVAVNADGVLDNGLKVGEFALGTVLDQPLVFQVHDPGRVVAAIFETLESLKENGDHPARADIADNATHVVSLLRVVGFFRTG